MTRISSACLLLLLLHGFASTAVAGASLRETGYALNREDIVSIVRAQFGWTYNHQGPTAEDAAVTGTNFEVLASEGELEADLETNLPLMRSGQLFCLVYVLDQDTHWTSLVVAARDGGGPGRGLVALYSDSRGPQQQQQQQTQMASPTDRVLSLSTVRAVLGRLGSPGGIDLVDVSSNQQQGDLSTSGLFALSNAFNACEMIRLGMSPSQISEGLGQADVALLRSAFADAVDNSPEADQQKAHEGVVAAVARLVLFLRDLVW